MSSTQWQCIDGNVWRIGLNCDVPAGVWEEVRLALTLTLTLNLTLTLTLTLTHNQTDDETIEETDCHQPLKGVGLLVKRELVALKEQPNFAGCNAIGQFA